MDKIHDFLSWFSRGAAMLGAIALLFVACISVVDIIVREASGRPIHGIYDLSGLLTIIIVAACFPAGLLEKRQIKVTLLRSVCSPAICKAMRVFGALLTGFMFLCIAWHLSNYAGKIAASAEYTVGLKLPIGPWWWIAAALFWFCVPAQLFVIAAEILNHKSAQEDGH